MIGKQTDTGELPPRVEAPFFAPLCTEPIVSHRAANLNTAAGSMLRVSRTENGKHNIMY